MPAKLAPEEFWRRISPVPSPTGCWLWVGPRALRGYGTWGRHGYAHRESLERHLGRKLSKDEEALHNCDTPRCVNPHHLRPGTQSENIKDAYDRGRKVSHFASAEWKEARHSVHQGVGPSAH